MFIIESMAPLLSSTTCFETWFLEGTQEAQDWLPPWFRLYRTTAQRYNRERRWLRRISCAFLQRPTLLADVAQLVEQLIRNQQVIGSSPIVGSIRVPFPDSEISLKV
jgi:hypothetical protein